VKSNQKILILEQIINIKMNKTAQQELPKITKEIKIDVENPDVFEHPELLRKILLPLEYQCMIIMLNGESPLSTNELYNQFIKHAMIKLQLKLNMDLAFNNKSNKNAINEMKKIEDEILRNFNYKDIRKGEIFLRENNQEFPAYKTLVKNMQVLESWNIVSRRNVKGRKEKFLWTINPRFYIKYGKKILEEYKNIKSMYDAKSGKKMSINDLKDEFNSKDVLFYETFLRRK
jgi:hypothetical protein